MPTVEEIKLLADQIPDPDKNGTYVNLDDAKIAQIDKAVAELQKGGRQAVLAIIDMLVEPGKGNDIKAHWRCTCWP